VINHHRPEYEQLCQRILPQFADTKSPYIAERISGDCLLLPHSGVDLQAVDKLATKAVTIGKNDSAVGYFEACKALSDYRLGKLPEAVEWAGKSLNASQASARAKGWAVLAMAKWKLGEKAGARTVLAEGEALAPSISATNGPMDLGDSWLAWLCAGIALDEAATLIQPAAAADGHADKP
jgi:hypothetical protein